METAKYPQHLIFGLDIGTRSIVGTVGYKQNEQDFIVVSQSIRYHETRAMLDGQIHDINKVAETIQEVKKELEQQIGQSLKEVCIAAAGRVLKTVTVQVQQEFSTEENVTEEIIRTLELAGVEKAYEEIQTQNQSKVNYYCVGYTVVHYYLNDYVMTNLMDHKASRIAADVLATFLPDEVIEGLYAAVNKAGLEVVNLTLEPIAAINIAIPEKFRLLNIALVDVGAGTSDISITKDGSIIAYGMIPMAGDEITNVIMQRYLVDFKTAEMIKTSAAKKKTITYKDIMGLSNKITREEVYAATNDIVEQITDKIAQQIIELNGQKSVSAVFVVGGGGKINHFTEHLADALSLPKERVALRGEEVLQSVTFLQEKIKKDPLLVTPIGICLNYYENRNNFIYVSVNGERIKLYDNSHLTVVDAALSVGYPNEKLFPRRGKAIEYLLNGQKRLVRGEAGEGAVILLNGKPAAMSASIAQNDIIQITESTAGPDAVMTIGKLPEYSGTIQFEVNGKLVICPKYVMANQHLVSDTYSIQDQDEITVVNYYTVEQLLSFMDLKYTDHILVNKEEAAKDTKVYENFSVSYPLETMDSNREDTEEEAGDQHIENHEHKILKNPQEEIQEGTNEKPNESNKHDLLKDARIHSIQVQVNDSKVLLNGKSSYIFVDLLDVYPFDLTTAKGTTVILLKNGTKCEFTTPIEEGDHLQIYWE